MSIGTADQIEQTQQIMEELDGVDIADVVRAIFAESGFILDE